MTLTFPTIAEQVVAEFRATGKSVAVLARKRNVEVKRRDFGREIEYTFDDDTSITTRGHGRAYKIETHLP